MYKVLYMALPILHPGNTIEVTQAGVIFRWRAGVLSWAVSSPATLYSI